MRECQELYWWEDAQECFKKKKKKWSFSVGFALFPENGRRLETEKATWYPKKITIGHISKAEKTFQQNWNFKSLGTRSLAWVFLKWSYPLNCKESFLKKGFSVNEAKAGKRGDCPSHLLMSNMLSHESGQFVWFGSLTESPVHLACWAQHQALGWSKRIAAFCVLNSLSCKQFFF